MQQTMQTLSAYNKQLNFDTNLTHQKTLKIYQSVHFLQIPLNC